MSEAKRIKTALVSVYHKEGLDEIITKLHEEGVEFLSTGGTRQFIESLGFPCKAVEDLTTYPSILGGRVKTLHPKVFGGILCRRGLEQDMQQIEKYEIPEIDLVIVDLYPFEATVASGAEEQAIIEKIDIGGISLIRAAAKNFKDVVIVASKAQYQPLMQLLNEKGLKLLSKTPNGLPKKHLPFLLTTIRLFSTISMPAKVLLSVALLIARSNFVTVKADIRKVISAEIWSRCWARFTEMRSLVTILSACALPLA